MDLGTLEDLKKYAVQTGRKGKIGVIAAQDVHTLQAVRAVLDTGLVVPVLYGDASEIRSIWKEISDGEPVPEIVSCSSVEEAIEKAISDVKTGRLQSLMKGKVETGVLMKQIVNRDTGIRKNELLSIVGLMESPVYHKLFVITDPGLVMYPNLNQKAGLIENAVSVMHVLGVESPKVAVLAAVEHESPKMVETMDAAALKKMNQEGKLTGCIVEGPVSLDLSISKEAAEIKGYTSVVAGDADILVVPDFVCGNLLTKGLLFLGKARSCGVVIGAQVPIVLVSRAASAEDKYFSILLSVIVGSKDREGKYGADMQDTRN